MAVAFRVAGAAVGTSTSTLSIAHPNSIVAGEMILVQYWCHNTMTPATPAGYTKLFGPVSQSGGSPYQSYIYYKVAAGTESGTNFTVTTTGTANGAGGIISIYTGCDTTTPVNQYATANLETTGTTGTCPTLTTTVANTMVLHMYYGYCTSTSVTPNASDTERYDTFVTTTSTQLELADRTQAAIGAIGTSTATFGAGTLFGGASATLALAPAAAAVPPVADFTGTPLSGTEPLSVAFTDASTNTPTSWAWTFGDGGTSSSQNPTHNYTTPGTYTVVLVATNAAGSNTKTRTGYITVTDQPRPIRINTSQGWADIADATSFVSGSGAPTAAVGATGAIYLNTATGLHYGPKAAGAWPGTPLPVPAGTPADATTSSKGIVQLAGDLAGTAASPQIAAGAIVDADVAAANKDGTAATPSLRTLGTGAQQAAAGNDSRLLKAAVNYGTSLPGSPVDGQEAILVDSTTAPTYSWRFRYNAGSSSTYKWEMVGGAPASNQIQTDAGTPGGTYNFISAGATPSLTLPRAGDYVFEYGGYCYGDTATQRLAYMCPNGGTYSANDADAAVWYASTVQQGRAQRTLRVNGLIAATYTLAVRTTSGTTSWSGWVFLATPIRVS